RSFVVFFFSSRGRHTRSKRDWSSDVCSSDLEREQPFDSLADLRDRARLSKKSLERLAQLGALDSMLAGTTVSRTDVVHHLEFLHSTTKRDRTGRAIRTGKTQ